MQTPFAVGILILAAFAITQIISENRSSKSRVYMVLVVLLLAYSQIPQLLFEQIPREQGKLLHLQPLRHWVFLIGPALYFYARACLNKKNKARSVLHLLPNLLWWVTFFFLSERGEQTREMRFIYGLTSDLSLLLYAILILFTLARHTKWLRNQFSFTDMFLEVKWLSIIALVLAILAVALPVAISIYHHVSPPVHPPTRVIPGDPEVITLIHSVAILIFLFVFATMSLKQERYAGLKKENRSLESPSPTKKTTTKENLPVLDKENPRERSAELDEIISYMKGSLIFLDNSLTLQMLSDKIGIGRNELSKAINSGTGENFFHFINGFRARRFYEAVQKNDYPEYTLLGIAMECGFNSKSTFNVAVKKEFNRTPSQILKDLSPTL